MNTPYPTNVSENIMNTMAAQKSSLASSCIDSICGNALTESEKIECLKKNKEQICRCCGGCDYSFKNVKISCKSDSPDDMDYSDDTKTESPFLNCWKKHCDTEDDKNKCLEKSRRSICNCCRENNIDCKFDMGDKGIYDACTNIYTQKTQTLTTTKPKNQALSETQIKNDSTNSYLGLWAAIVVIGLLIIGGGIYYYKKNIAKASTIHVFDGEVSKVVPIKQVFS